MPTDKGAITWKMLLACIGALTVLVGVVSWANSGYEMARQALKLGEENKTKIDAQSNSLTELRVDMKYLINSVNELKDKKTP